MLKEATKRKFRKSFAFGVGSRQNGSISQLKRFVQPAHSAAKSKPLIPLKREACVIFNNYSPKSRMQLQ